MPSPKKISALVPRSRKIETWLKRMPNKSEYLNDLIERDISIRTLLGQQEVTPTEHELMAKSLTGDFASIVKLREIWTAVAEK